MALITLKELQARVTKSAFIHITLLRISLASSSSLSNCLCLSSSSLISSVRPITLFLLIHCFGFGLVLYILGWRNSSETSSYVSAYSSLNHIACVTCMPYVSLRSLLATVPYGALACLGCDLHLSRGGATRGKGNPCAFLSFFLPDVLVSSDP